MNFIMKFLEKKFATKKDMNCSIDSVAERCMVLQNSLSENEGNVNKNINDIFRSLALLELRISGLEEESVFVQAVAGTGGVKLNSISTTDAIIDVLTHEDGKKLHYSDIYSKMKGYNLINPNVTLQSVKAILYQLARQKRIVLDNGTETGMFFFEKE